MVSEATLYTRLELRMANYERQLAKANKTTDVSLGAIERRSKKAAATLESSLGGAASRVSGVIKASFAGLAAGIAAGGVGGLISGFADVAKGVAEIGDQAARAGLTTKAFQELKFAAEQSRVGVDAVVDGLKEMSLRASEFVNTGGGSAADAFKRIGLNASDLKEKLRAPNELFLEIIGKLGQLDKASQIQLSDELFGGTGGEQFVQLIEQGEKGLRKSIAAANDLGIVMDDQLIKKAAEVDRQFTVITTTVGMNLKTAIIEAAAAMQGFLDTYKGFAAEYARNKNIVDAGAIMGGMVGVGPATPVVKPGSPAAPKTNRIKNATDIMREKLLEQRFAEAWKDPDPFTPTKEKTGGGKTRDAAAAAAERERKAVTDLIADLEFEQSLIGKTAVQKEQMTALRQAGKAATEGEKTAIEAKVAAIYTENAAVEASKAAITEANDAARDFAGTLVSGFTSGASAAETLGNALKNLGDRLVNSGLDSLFDTKSGGLLSSLFGGGGFKANTTFGNFLSGVPGFATGTNSAPRGVALVGEKGPELVRFGGGEMVIPNNKLSAPTMPRLGQQQSGGSMPAMTFAPNIDARGASVEAVARLEQVVKRQQQEFAANVLTTMRKARSTRNW